MAGTQTSAAPATAVGAAADMPAERPHLTVETAAIAVAVTAGVVLRFWATSPLWLDEALSVNIAALPLGDIAEALRHDGHPPLYYFILHGWMQVAGDGDLAVRALSGLFGVAALPLAWLAARRAAGPIAGWAAVVLVAVSPFAIRYSTEARMYSLVIALVLVGYLLIGDGVTRGGRWRLVFIALTSGALLLTHYWALWLVGATVVVLGWRAVRHPDRDVRGRYRRVTVAVAAGGLLLLPWLPSMVEQAEHTGTPWGEPARPTEIVRSTLTAFGSTAVGPGLAEGVVVGIALAMLFALGLFGRAVDGNRIELDVRTVGQVRRESVVVALTVALATVAAYATASAFASRYTAVIFPLVIVVAAAGVSRFAGRLPRLVVMGVVVGLCLVGAVLNVTSDRTQAGGIAAAIAEGARPGDVVAFCPDQLGPAVDRELPQAVVGVVYPTLAAPERVDWVDYEERHNRADPADFADAVRARAAPSGSVWLVTSFGYRTLEGDCERVVSELGARWSSRALVVREDPDVFEHAALYVFRG